MRENYFMKQALEQAKIAFEKDEVPVGSVVVENGEIIATSHNQNLELKDPTAHAEIVALRKAALAKGVARLDGCDIYVTLEPCLMCAAAISLARIRRIYYAASDKKFGAIESNFTLSNSLSSYHKFETYGGISEAKSKELLQKFFQARR